MTQAIAHNAEIIMSYRERIFGVLMACLFFTLCIYGYSLQRAIVNVVQREAIMKTINAKGSQVADLEAKYFSRKNSVSLDLAHAEGFKEAPVSMFISKKALGVALGVSNEL